MALDKRGLLIEKVYRLLNLAIQEMKTARDYGNGFKLHHSEVHALEAINDYEGANISDLAGPMGVTIGAVWQVARKLKASGIHRLRNPEFRPYRRGSGCQLLPAYPG